MARLPKDRERQELEREIEGKEYQLLLNRLQREHPFYRQFHAWGGAVAFMRDGSSRDPLKDEVLRPILAEHARDDDPRWRTILLVIFWPGLKSLCIKRRRLDTESDALWSNAVWAFLEAVRRLDLAKRPSRLVQKLMNDTASGLRAEYRRARHYSTIEVPTARDLLECLAGGAEDAGLMEVYLDEEREFQAHRFREHMLAGLITETDLALVTGSRVYGKPLCECADEAGLSYEAARKRRQRAECAIGRAEGATSATAENPKKSPGPCPRTNRFAPFVLSEAGK